MTTPANSTKTAAGRIYRWGGVDYPSVTTVLDVLGKPQLYGWYASKTADRALAYMAGSESPDLEQPTMGELRKWMARAPIDARDTSAGSGTDIHGLIEEGVPGDQWPEPYTEHGLNWEAFVRLYRPRFLEKEATVYSTTSGYAGTFDALVELDGKTYVLDVKTGTSVYPEVALQIAAYRYADFIGRADGKTQSEMPPTDGGLVLHLRAEGFKLVPVEADAAAFGAFRSALRIYRWRRNSKTAIGKAIPPPVRMAVGA